jgi:hypothetical protein
VADYGQENSRGPLTERAGEGQIIPFKEADLSPAYAHRCWTSALRTSEHPYTRHLGE